ncbi:hypothetical protein HPO_09368 [Hyphomonas polymorpha PS728]|uniref:Uncharacterized protein n=1 Tax=Hyphomonas polymorpha PS728 TaxID=1280954 RepID=A0A062VGY8_9PROT|nr:hypothetical protein [Hyphomonas polymorpha]KCZ98754.1 hypothetical protein HPO_09368 [Hyphomonas polymorpha PS728]
MFGIGKKKVDNQLLLLATTKAYGLLSRTRVLFSEVIQEDLYDIEQKSAQYRECQILWLAFLLMLMDYCIQDAQYDLDRIDRISVLSGSKMLSARDLPVDILRSTLHTVLQDCAPPTRSNVDFMLRVIIAKKVATAGELRLFEHCLVTTHNFVDRHFYEHGSKGSLDLGWLWFLYHVAKGNYADANKELGLNLPMSRGATE